MIPLLEARGLGKSFGGLKALDQLSFALMPGQILGLIGPNGSGKTTTINVITGIYQATSGKVRLEDREVTGLRPHKIMKSGLARTFQNLRLFPARSVLDNIRAGQHVRTTMWQSVMSAVPTRIERALTADAMDLAERFQLQHRLHSLAGELSYGEKKRLEIARALASGPRVLLLDEPAAGMNASEVNWLTETLRDIRRTGISILIVEHHMKLIMGVCDEIVVLNFGLKIAQGAPAEVSTHPDVISAYLGTPA